MAQRLTVEITVRGFGRRHDRIETTVGEITDQTTPARHRAPSDCGLRHRGGDRHRPGQRLTGVLLVAAMIFAPLVTVIPHEASAPALIVVGFVMMVQVRSIEWDDGEVALASFLTIVVMPFTYSITAGIGTGFVAYSLLMAARGRAREVHLMVWAASALFLLWFAMGPLKGLLGVG